MSKTTLKEIIKLAPGFKAAVNLNYDRDRIEKAGSYLPTQVGSQVLFDVAKNLHPTATRRARLVMGTYGTGKSHLALVLTYLYSRRWDDRRLENLFARLADRWPGETQQLKQELERIRKPFLIVRLEGDEGSFNEALLRALRRALSEDERTRCLIPDTAFEAAARRIDELRSSYPEAYRLLDEALKQSGLVSAEVAKERLRDYSREAYQGFLEAHKQACAGAEFHPEQMMKPSEAYKHLSRQLREKELFDGIVIFWDEFGRYMERMADDPGSDESLDIQSFAEVCSVAENNMHLYLICHRSLEEYARVSHLRRGRGDEQRLAEDMRKVTGRFTPFIMRSADDEIYGLVDQVIIQERAHPIWQKLVSERGKDLESLTQFAVTIGLFPDFTREELHRVITVGCFPLHPATAFCLPRLSEVVAQNERTLFTYLSDSGEGSLGRFIESALVPEAEEPLPLATLADLWDYFEEQIRSDEEARKVYRLYESAVARVSPDDVYAVQILKAVGVLTVLGQRVRNLKATAGNLACSLNVP